MTKRVILYNFKRWFPLYIVLLAVLSTVMVVATSTFDLYEGFHLSLWAVYGGSPTPTLSDAPLIVFNFLIFIFEPVIAFVALSHTYKKKQADFYKQIPMERNKLRRIRIIESGVLYLIVVTIAFFIGIFILGLRYATAPASYEATYGDTTYTLNKGSFVFPYYLLYYLIVVVLLAAGHITHVAVASLGDNLFDAIFIFLLIESGLIALVQFCLIFATRYDLNFQGALHISPSWFVGPGQFLQQTGLFSLMVGKEADSMALNYIDGISIIIYILMVGYGIASIFLMQEKGGEYYGAKGPHNLFMRLLPHIVVLVTFLVASFQSYGDVDAFASSTVVFYGALYYVAVSLYNHNFKLKKLDWILWGSITGIYFLVTLGSILQIG